MTALFDPGPLTDELHQLRSVAARSDAEESLLAMWRLSVAVRIAQHLTGHGTSAFVEPEDASVVLRSSGMVLTPTDWAEGLSLREALEVARRQPTLNFDVAPTFERDGHGQWYLRPSLEWLMVADKTFSAYATDWLELAEWWAPCHWFPALSGWHQDTPVVEGVVVLTAETITFLPHPDEVFFDSRHQLPAWSIDHERSVLVHHTVTGHCGGALSYGFDVHTDVPEPDHPDPDHPGRAFPCEIVPKFRSDAIEKTQKYLRVLVQPEPRFVSHD